MKTSQRISDALSAKRWHDAATLLCEIDGEWKLGSLQRWVREADGARLDDAAMSRAMMWLLCRLAAEQSIEKPPTDAQLKQGTTWAAPPEKVDPSDDETVVVSSKVVYREKARDRRPPNRYDLRIWGGGGREMLSESPTTVRHDFPAVEGVFVVTNVFSPKECRALLDMATRLGFDDDEALPRDEIDKTRGAFACLDSDDDDVPEITEKKEPSFSERSRACVWVVDEALNDALFERCAPHLPRTFQNCTDARGKQRGDGTLAGLNRRWRFYRYDAHGTYRPHVDGAWPGSSFKDDAYIYDAFHDRLSKLTCLVYLNNDFDGGATAFYSADDDGRLRVDNVMPRAGSVLFFPHGCAAGSLIHEGSTVTSGSKFVIRTDVLYRWDESSLPPSSSSSRRRSPEDVSGEGHPSSSSSLFSDSPPQTLPKKQRKKKKR